MSHLVNVANRYQGDHQLMATDDESDPGDDIDSTAASKPPSENGVAPDLSALTSDEDGVELFTDEKDTDDEAEAERNDQAMQFLPSTMSASEASPSKDETAAVSGEEEKTPEGDDGEDEEFDDELLVTKLDVGAEPVEPEATSKPVVTETTKPAEEIVEKPPEFFPFSLTRQEAYMRKTWWMVDLTACQAGGNVDSDKLPKQGATVLVRRVIRTYFWDEEHARRVLKAYRQFLMLKTEQQDWYSTKLSPCAYVELMWKAHIVDMQNYYADMKLLCGEMINYDPDEAEAVTLKEQRLNRTRSALRAKFGSKYDEELWHFEFPGPKKKNIIKTALKGGKDKLPPPKQL